MTKEQVETIERVVALLNSNSDPEVNRVLLELLRVLVQQQALTTQPVTYYECGGGR